VTADIKQGGKVSLTSFYGDGIGDPLSPQKCKMQEKSNRRKAMSL